MKSFEVRDWLGASVRTQALNGDAEYDPRLEFGGHLSILED